MKGCYKTKEYFKKRNYIMHGSNVIFGTVACWTNSSKSASSSENEYRKFSQQ